MCVAILAEKHMLHGTIGEINNLLGTNILQYTLGGTKYFDKTITRKGLCCFKKSTLTIIAYVCLLYGSVPPLTLVYHNGWLNSSHWSFIANEGIGIILMYQTSHSIYFLVGYLDIKVYPNSLSLWISWWLVIKFYGLYQSCYNISIGISRFVSGLL